MRWAALFLALGPASPQGAGPEGDALDPFFQVRWIRGGLKPAAPCDDATFLRRVSLDLAGCLPEPGEIRDFLKSTRKDKRARKIEQLLESPEAAEHFAYLWVQWLMGHDIDFRDLRRLDLAGLCAWLKKAWAEDLPFEDFVRALLSPVGRLRDHPPSNFAAKHLTPGEPPVALARAAARLFLGRDIRCAQCHDHPAQAFSQEDFWSYTAFFRGLELRGDAVAEAPLAAPGPPREDLGERFPAPRFLDGRGPEGDESPLQALPRLFLTLGKDEVRRAAADRYWMLLLGRPLLPRSGAKGDPPLLDLLARGFASGKGSLRDLVRRIVSSRVYQMSSEGPEALREGYASGPLKLMNTVQFMRAWNHAFQWEEYFRKQYEKHPERVPLMREPDVFWMARTMQAKELLFPKGRDPEEVLSSGTDRLAIKLMNNRDIQLMMVAPSGLVQKVMKKSADPGRRIEELFLLMLGRLPTAGERSRLVEHVRGAGRPEHAFVDGYADVFWMLLNSSEFIFIG